MFLQNMGKAKVWTDKNKDGKTTRAEMKASGRTMTSDGVRTLAPLHCPRLLVEFPTLS